MKKLKIVIYEQLNIAIKITSVTILEWFYSTEIMPSTLLGTEKVL